MTIPLKALIVEDVASDADLLLRNLKKDGFSVISRRVETELEMEAALTSEDWDIILSDCSLPAFSGIEALKLVNKINLDIPFIVVSGTIGEENAIDLMKAGAKDIIYKNKMLRLGEIIKRELDDLSIRKKQKKDEEQMLLTLDILSKLNSISPLSEIIEHIVITIKALTGFDAVGIRLKEGEDFPYCAQKGFSKEFITAETSLVAHNKHGDACKDKNGNVCLEGTCGLVIAGKVDLNNTLFTENGSAWTNNSTSLLDLSAKKDPRTNPRNLCILEGYLSIAIIPIRMNQDIIGLLHLNDRRKDRLTLNFIKYLEYLGGIIGIGITKYKAEEKIIVSESRYKGLFNSAYITIMLADANTGEIIDVNKDAEKLFGRKRDELIGLNRIELHPQIESDYYKKQFLRHVEQHGVSTEQAQIVKKDGTLVNVLISSSLIELNGQTVIQGIFQDITDIFNAKEKQKQSEEKYQNLFEHISSAIIVVDVETDRILEVNAYAEILFGRIRTELVGLNWFDLHYKEQADDYIPRFKNHIKFSKIFNEEIIVLKKDGTRSFMLLSVNKLEINGVKVFRLVFTDNTAAKKAEESLELSRENLEKALYSTVDALASTVEAKDTYTAGHQRRVSFLSAAIALELGYSENRIRLVKTAAIVHDIGKIQVPTEILSKPGKLSKIEFDFIKTHVQASYDILKNVEFPWPIADIVHQHHERVNGTGYPQGLKGDEILPEAKIITVADVIEAITSHRPYRDALGIDIALKEIQINRGIFYDPIVVDACIKLFKEKDFHFVGGGNK